MNYAMGHPMPGARRLFHGFPCYWLTMDRTMVNYAMGHSMPGVSRLFRGFPCYRLTMGWTMDWSMSCPRNVDHWVPVEGSEAKYVWREISEVLRVLAVCRGSILPILRVLAVCRGSVLVDTAY